MLETVFLFCSDARTAADGKLDIQGVFNELYAPDFPARQDRLVLVGIVEWPRKVDGRVPFSVDLVGPDGISVFTVEGHTDVDRREPSRAPAKTQFVLPLTNVMFPAPGRYRVRATINGEQVDGPSMHLMRT